MSELLRVFCRSRLADMPSHAASVANLALICECFGRLRWEGGQKTYSLRVCDEGHMMLRSALKRCAGFRKYP
jgi:hypothetical protein